jgi:hypothetical protein
MTPDQQQHIREYLVSRSELVEAQKRHEIALENLIQTHNQDKFPENLLVVKEGKCYQIEFGDDRIKGFSEVPDPAFLNLDL